MQSAPDTFPAESDYRNVTPTHTGQVFSQDAVTAAPLFTPAFVPLADPIDIVKDYIPPHEYLAEEDPKLYQSVKTKRGPLSDDWIEEINQSPGQSPVMCAYKLCKVEFRYWGMQSKIERFIHDVGTYGTWCVYVHVHVFGPSHF